jgi:hypothetical protein
VICRARGHLHCLQHAIVLDRSTRGAFWGSLSLLANRGPHSERMLVRCKPSICLAVYLHVAVMFAHIG